MGKDWSWKPPKDVTEALRRSEKRFKPKLVRDQITSERVERLIKQIDVPGVKNGNS